MSEVCLYGRFRSKGLEKDQSRTVLGSHLQTWSDRQLSDRSADCVRTVRGHSADGRTGLTVLNMFKNFCLLVSGPSDLNRERIGPRSVDCWRRSLRREAELNQTSAYIRWRPGTLSLNFVFSLTTAVPRS
jgi:hypothetical protein